MNDIDTGKRPTIDIILASRPWVTPVPEGLVEMLEAQDDFRIVARPETPDQLWSALRGLIASVLVVVPGIHGFAAVIEDAAKRGMAVAVVCPSHATGPDVNGILRTGKVTEKSFEYLQDDLKRAGARVFYDAPIPDVIDYVRKIAHDRSMEAVREKIKTEGERSLTEEDKSKITEHSYEEAHRLPPAVEKD
jgi:hypothetical protein